MGDPKDHGPYLALLRAQPWGQLSADLVLYALRKKRLSPDLAEQVAADTIARVCDPVRSPWDPSRGAKLFTHLTWILDSELDNYRAKRRRRKTDPVGDDLPEPPPDSDGDPDVRAIRSGDLAAVRERLYEAVKRRPLALKLLQLQEEDIADVEDQIVRTGATRAQIYEARRFLAETVRATLASGDDHLSRERSALARDEAARAGKKVGE